MLQLMLGNCAKKQDMVPFVVLHSVLALVVMDIDSCQGTPMRDELRARNHFYEKEIRGSSEDSQESLQRYGIDDNEYWQFAPSSRESYDSWDSDESPASSRDFSPILYSDESVYSPSSPSPFSTNSPSASPSTLRSSPSSLANSLSPPFLTSSSSPSLLSSTLAPSSAWTPSSWTVTSQSPEPTATPRPSPHEGEHLHWLLKQEQRRHPWQAPPSAPRAIQEALDAYKHTDYQAFCQHAMIEDKVPLRITDGSFHPKFEMVPSIGVYRFHATPATWKHARVICEDEGAQIAIVNSFQEAKVLSEIHNRCPFILDTHFNDYQYLGAHDIYSEGKWETTKGDKLNETGYLRWGYGQPDNAHHNGENCLAMNRYGFFNDVPCWVKLPFTCEHA